MPLDLALAMHGERQSEMFRFRVYEETQLVSYIHGYLLDLVSIYNVKKIQKNCKNKKTKNFVKDTKCIRKI